MKACSKCGKLKPESEFYNRILSKDGLNPACKTCVKRDANQRSKRKRSYDVALLADFRKNSNLQKHYGISLGDYENQLTDQSGGCAICGRGPEAFQRAFAVDHDHATGKVRGILCPDCNRGLGGFHDDVDLMAKAIEYLKRNAQD